ncbi:MAG: hypothetical protein U5K79_14355 [Cyclobacteriaceae bacterium]|nr:hypothetical protein [Cyclobacteriaceae bacterium]
MSEILYQDACCQCLVIREQLNRQTIHTIAIEHATYPDPDFSSV